MQQTPIAITYIIGDATLPLCDDKKILVHVCNNRGGWGQGFVVALFRRYLEPEAAYRQWYKERATNDFALGAVQFVRVTPDLAVANLIGQDGYRTRNGSPPVRYDAIRLGLQKVAHLAQKHPASVHMPRIGCGLAGGDWSEIEPIIQATLSNQGISVFVYDLPI